MKQYSGRRAANLAAFQQEVARKKQVVADIWKRDESRCRYCKRPVQPAMRGVNSPGYVQWQDPRVITVDGGWVVCRQHYVRQMVTL